jgi:integrase
MFEEYVQHLKDTGKRSADDVAYTLRRMAEIIGPNRVANQITSKDIIAAIRPTYAAGHASMADHMRGYVRSAFGWAIKSQNDYRAHRPDHYRLIFNPAENIPTEPKVPGDRWLSLDELRAFWNWQGTQHANRNTDPRNYTALRFLMLTGQRSEEIARLSAGIINRDLMVIDWPKTKNGKAHVLPITDLMMSLLDGVEPNQHGLLFPSEVFPERCISDQTMRFICVRYCKATGAKRFSPRDLRRTWKTWAGHAGLSKEERDRLQNHAPRDVSSVHYDRYDYLKEKRSAMERWCEWFSENVDIKKAPM